MRVLVTGAAGFIGRHVVDVLIAAGHDVTGMDVVHSDPELRADWIRADITKPLSKIDGLDAIIHLAAVANPRECDSNPTKAFDVNVNGTHQVLKLAHDMGVRKVLFSSTAHVYGISPRYMPTDETHPLWLQNNYTLTKILGEQLCHLYHENYGLSYTALRLFNAYGPGQAKGYFIPDMLSKGASFTLPGGNTTKDFVYIDDVARAFLLALETPFVGHINVGTGVETPLADIAYAIAIKHGLDCISSDAKDATRMCADITRAKRVLGWVPTKTVQEGLRAILDAQKAAILS